MIGENNRELISEVYMSNTKKTSGNISIIGGSDGPTSVFLVGSKKKTLKQRVQKRLFALKKKWVSLGVKPNAHTMDEVIDYVKEKYGFVESAKDSHEYVSQHDSMKTSFMMQYAPELLGEYAVPPELKSRDAEGLREFQEQYEIRKRKALEVPEEKFPLDFHILEKTENGNNMHLYMESRFGYIGGGFSGSGKGGKSGFGKIYKDVYRYYGVTEDDIANETKRYKDLITTLAMR